MKKNFLRKVVASLATAAMAVGMFAVVPAQEVKAADKETEIVLVMSGETTADKVLLDIDGQDAGITSAGTVDTSVPWGRDMYAFTKDASDAKRYSIKVTGDVVEGYCNMQFLLVTNGEVKGYKYYPQDARDIFNNNDKIYVQIDLSADNWSVVSASADDPNAAKPSDIMAVIDEIGTVELTDDCLNKIKAAESAYNTFTGDKSAVTNYDKLTAARAKFTELLTAGAGTLTVYVKNADWSDMYVYGWDGAEFGTWPGKELTALKNNAGWYSCSFDINQVTNLIFNSKAAGTQTIDWKYVSAGTYWITLSEKGDDGKYLVNESNIAKKAPTGWKSEEAEKVEAETTTQAPTTKPTQTTTEKETTTTIPVAVDKTEVEKIAASATIKNAPADTKLNISALTDEAVKAIDTFKSTTLKGMKYQALDITLVKNNTTEAVQPGAAVEITIAVMDSLKSAKAVEIFRVDGDKLTSVGKADVVDGKITFSTDHFSTYVFAEAKSATVTGDIASVAMMLAIASMAAVAVVSMRKKTAEQ